MEIFVIIIVIVVGFFIYTILKTNKYNNDIEQKGMAAILAQAAFANINENNETYQESIQMLINGSSKWRSAESQERLIHALSLVKMMGDAELYDQAKKIAERLHKAFGA